MALHILITGGAGFIGSNLCAFLFKRGNRITCVDNLITGRRENIEDLIKEENFQFLEHDIIHPLEIKGRIDEIYNLACPASPPHYQKDPVFTLKTNVFGTYNLLNLACEKKAKIFQASTSEVYGDPEVHPQVENYRGCVNPIGIRACYDEGKRAAETLCYDYKRQYGLDVRVARIFNTYGPYMDPEDGRVISNFIMQALREEDITIYGDGLQTRSFCYVSDILEAIFCMMKAETQQDFPINIGNDQEFTIRKTAELVLGKVRGKSKLIRKTLPSDDPMQRKPDLSRAKKFLHWQPSISLDEGLDRTIDYFRQHLSEN